MNDLLKKVLPWIGAAATGNVPMLIGMAAKVVSGVIGQDVAPTAEAVAQAVMGANPEQVASLKHADEEFRLRANALGFQHAEEMERLSVRQFEASAADTADARAKHAGDKNVFRLGLAIIATFAIVLVGSMFGAYAMLTGGISIKDVGIVAAVFGFIGTVVGYAAANAQQVVSFFFGSSAGSKQKTDAMADAFRSLGKGKLP